MTITSPPLGALLTFIIGGVVYTGVRLWRRRVPGLAAGPSTRAALYLERYAMALEYYGCRRAEITSHVEALRGDLATVDAADVGNMLHRLGPPRTLAAEVTSGTLRPSWLRGAMWAGAAWMLVLVLAVIATEAFLGGFEAVARPGDEATWSGVGFSTDATMGSDGRATTIGFGGWVLVLIPVLAFVLGARPWRLRRGLRTQPHTSHA